ncbi:thioesterase family protein [Castellaniella sp.]|uniref:thioesterase family protein n=1 Tax=Castellaniella sp. TaxID=1955812 RepID=UPI00355E0ED5
MALSKNLHLGHDGTACPHAYYVRQDTDRFISTLHAQGSWQPGEQHLAPAAGLVLAEAERRLPGDKLISRVTFDVLGVIHSGPFTIEVDVVRPGRTIELIEARMCHGHQTSIQARIWRLETSDTTSIQALEWNTLPPRETMPTVRLGDIWTGGFMATLEAHQSTGNRPGRGQTWLRTEVPLVADEIDPPVAGFTKLVDTVNGISARLHSDQAFFANVDLTVHFIRQPTPGWVGFDTHVNFGPTGLGETFAVLSDAHGPVGTVAQSLTLRLR